jgi:glutathione S-transferase
MKLYGHPMSTCTRKVLTTLAETNTPYELIVVDLSKGEQKQPAHTARQPFGQVPVIDDDGFQIYESRAICRYIDDKARGNLQPTDTFGRARMEQWISVESSNFTPPAMKFIFHHVFQRPQPADALEAAGKQLDVALNVMDAELGKQAYFAGEEFTLADICFMPYVEYALATPIKDSLTKRKNLMRWWNKVGERPSWRKAAGRG